MGILSHVESAADTTAIQLLTKPTDFEQSEELKLLLHGEHCRHVQQMRVIIRAPLPQVHSLKCMLLTRKDGAPVLLWLSLMVFLTCLQDCRIAKVLSGCQKPLT
jgi:hypothetical protein